MLVRCGSDRGPDGGLDCGLVRRGPMASGVSASSQANSRETGVVPALGSPQAEAADLR